MENGYEERLSKSKRPLFLRKVRLKIRKEKLKLPKFVSTHAIACMTRQDVSRLLKRFKEEENADVINIRVLCDTLSGRLVCEWEARDSVTLIEWLKKCNVQIRGTGEWLMTVQYESVEDELVVPPRHNT